jgi:hypothetical protein
MKGDDCWVLVGVGFMYIIGLYPGVMPGVVGPNPTCDIGNGVPGVELVIGGDGVLGTALVIRKAS